MNVFVYTVALVNCFVVQRRENSNSPCF